MPNQSKTPALRPPGRAGATVQNQKHVLSQVEGSKIGNHKSKIDWLLLALLALLIFIPRLLDLDVFLTADEPLFLQHSRDFATGLASGDFGLTLGIGYPGVTVAWWSAPVVGLASTELGAFVAGRVATALMTGLLLLAMYGLARSFLGRWPAFIGVALLALDPYSLAYGRLLHIGAPLALFMTLAGLSFLLWLRDARYRWLFLAGLFTGLALLTKSTAMLLGPMLVAGTVGWTLSPARSRRPRWWLRQLAALIVVGLVAAAVFFLLWPAMWVDPAGAFGLTFGKLLTDQEAGAGNLGMFWLGRFVEDPGPAFYFVAFLLKSTPWLLAGLLLSLYQLAKMLRRSLSPSPEYRIATIISLWLLALTYLIVMTLASKKSIRYMLPVFPIFYLLASQSFCQLGHSATQYLTNMRRTTSHVSRFTFHASERSLPVRRFIFSAPLLLVLSLLLLSLFTLFYHPYYFTYYNPLLLGWRWAPHTLLVGWGEGLDGAARYLNQQPPATVSAWYEWLFPIYYRGETEPVVPQENLLTADHAVLYVNQVQRDIPTPNIIHYFQTRRRPEQTIRLAGIDYAWVYPGPIAGFRPDPAPVYPLGGDFGGQARLLGYDLHPQPRSGQALIVTLYWRVLARPATDLFVYARLVDDRGHIWAKTDGPPVMGLWPADRWQPEMLVEDAHELLLPPDMPPGLYRLEAGLYDPATGQTLPAGGQPVGQGGGLLLGQVEVEWQPSSLAPDLPGQTDTRLAPNARLIGYDPPPAAAVTGDILSLRLGWRKSATVLSFLAMPNDFVRFEWQANGEGVAEQLDPLPLPIEAWGRRATLLSQHQVIVPPALETGRYDLVVGLHTGSDPAGESFLLGSVEVTAPPHQFALPAGVRAPSGPAQLAQQVTLAGYDLDPEGQSLAVQLYWQTGSPLERRYKIFVQLLNGSNSVVAQSDSFPAAGQRPTTGWLPGEIIVEAHTLALPSDLPGGSYRLITGLYDPLTGERLPVRNGDTAGFRDAILVSEVTVP
jgi:4-amino-4-deoxy-L-arabinose transferase-like glycosyltransferase